MAEHTSKISITSCSVREEIVSGVFEEEEFELLGLRLYIVLYCFSVSILSVLLIKFLNEKRKISLLKEFRIKLNFHYAENRTLDSRGSPSEHCGFRPKTAKLARTPASPQKQRLFHIIV